MAQSSAKQLKEVLKRVKAKRVGIESPNFLARQGLTTHLERELREGEYTVFFMQTSGDSPDNSGIIEIFALKYIRGKVTENFHRIVDPGMAIPDKYRNAFKKRGIPDSEFIPVGRVVQEFIEFVGNDVLISHNVIRDVKFLRDAYKKAKDSEIENYFISTRVLAKKLIDDVENFSLVGLAEYYFIPIEKGIPRAESLTKL